MIFLICFFSGCSRNNLYQPTEYDFWFEFVPSCYIVGDCEEAFHSNDTFLIDETYHCTIRQNACYSSIKLILLPNDEYFIINNFEERRYNKKENLYYYDFEITFIKYAQIEPIKLCFAWGKTGEVYYTCDVYVR